jgi:hypothetical protein
MDISTTRVCQGEDLEAIFGGTNALTGGQLTGGIVLLNVSPTACRVGGFATVIFLDANGDNVPIVQQAIETLCASGQCDPAVLQPGVKFVAHEATPGTAGFVVLWPTHDGAGFCNPPPPTITRMRVILPETTNEIEVTAPDEPIEIRPCDSAISVLPIMAATDDYR